MSGVFSQALLKVGFYVKNLNKTGAFSCISKQTSILQNASFTSLMPSSFFIPPRPYQVFGRDAKAQLKQSQTNQLRTVTKFSYQKGRRKSVKAVPSRFFRLHWGIWIRTIAGRHKKLWKRTNKRKNELLKHVFCNSSQSKMLDKMVNRFWRVPKYYIEDPYEIYHTRENFLETKRKPWRPDGVDYE